ncbi:MAG: helix-turn-helix domain-containing protein [Clostridia bacterium]|nr:helix-turn-helix domain-containing protein [Clostridia bacterium]MBP3801735.1 helix-turn-helix domain-containing protein [Clostridia bacterium]
MSENNKLGISVDEAAQLLGIGKNLMLKLTTVDGFPAIRFKRKIIINKNKLQQWFDENSGTFGNYT